ncbi:NAD(P)-binding protein [Poronia punctata]|nr:NAD(P)-binding protein [Poronia punctata]
MATDGDGLQLRSASFLNYFYRQLTYKPVPVRDVDLTGKTAIVTGSNSGVGFETARQLLELGLSKLILAVRDEDKGEAAAAKLTTDLRLTEKRIEVWKLDMSVYESITAFVERAERDLDRLDIVILNVGMWSPIKRVFNQHTGHDEVIQVNYISTALLSILLLPVVAKSKAEDGPLPRITFNLSEVAAFTSFKEKERIPLLSGLGTPGNVDPTDRMFVSKLLGQFFVRKLASIVPPSIAVINSVSPGAVHSTGFNREFEKTFKGSMVVRVQRLMANSPEVGARMIVDAAVNHGKETHGQFLSFQSATAMAPIISTEEGREISERLWEETMAEFSFVGAREILDRITTES